MTSGSILSRNSVLHGATLLAATIGLYCLFEARGTFSATFDESNHLACGLEWWQFGSYAMWTENPPLPRIAVAMVPYLAGMRLPPRESWEPEMHYPYTAWRLGLDRLYGEPGFDVNLRRARLGTLPFFVLALAAAWFLAEGRRRPGAGLVAVALTATTPALFAHGALATTDVAFVGTFLLAVLLTVRWFESPTLKRAAPMGVSLAVTLLCKFSTLAFFPIAILAMVAARRWAKLPGRPVRDTRPLPWAVLAGQVGLATVLAFITTWSCYRFSVGRIDDFLPAFTYWFRILPESSERGALTAWLLHTRLPMPELFHGIRFLAAHDAFGHSAYLLGKTSEHGFLTFYPLALLVKTPLPSLILFGLYLPRLARRASERWRALALSLLASGILLVTLRSHINLGIRHVFVVLPLAIVAAAQVSDGRIEGLRGRRRLLMLSIVGALLVGQSVAALAARRTALGYFNVLAGSDPARILVDSDLDWGQDLYLLRAESRARGVDHLKIAYFGLASPCRHALPALSALVPGRPTNGWIAISENYYRNRSAFPLLKDPCDPTSSYGRGEVPLGSFAWLEQHVPVTIAGTSIRLYHLP